MNTVKYLSKETYQKELSTDEDYNNIEDKKDRYPQINVEIPDYNLIRMSQTGKYSVSKLDESFITTNEIKHFYNTFINTNNNEISITDATANAGGNTINFSLSKFNVNSIELSQKEFERLSDNVSQYNLNNVKLFNGNSLELLFNKKTIQDIVYFDPPWGGTTYKQYKLLGLSLDDPFSTQYNDIGDHIDKLLQQNICKLVVLKGPYNTFIKNKQFLNLSISVKLKIQKGEKRNVKNYYNLYFFSMVKKSIVNSYYKQLNKLQQIVNINPFYQLEKNNNSFERTMEKSFRYNDNWDIYNVSIVLFQNEELKVENKKLFDHSQEVNVVNTIIVKNPLNLTHDLNVIIEKFKSSLILSLIINKEHINIFKTLVDNIRELSLSDICIVNKKEISINKVYSYILENNFQNIRIYFLRVNRVF